jgi:hypothetical protein
MRKSLAEKIRLSDLVLGTRKELLKIRDNRDVQKDPLLELTELEFEVNVEFSKAGKMGLEFAIVKGSGGIKSARSNRIKITFKPLTDEYIVRPEHDNSEQKSRDIMMGKKISR